MSKAQDRRSRRDRWALASMVLAVALVGSALLAAFTSPIPAHAAFPGQNGKIAFDREGDIWTIDPDGSFQTFLTCGGVMAPLYSREEPVRAPVGEPAWSPDGQRLAFTAFVVDHVGRGSANSIFLMRADGSARTRVSGGSEPSWAPDGQRIALTTNNNYLEPAYIAVSDLDGGRVRDLDAEGQSPAWSPDGEQIAYRDSKGGIWVMTPDGADQTQLSEAGHGRPAWSPDGARIAFGNEGGIWIMNADGSNQMRLTNPPHPFQDFDPAWSPDGEKIVFVRFAPQPSGRDIWVLNADGTGEANLTNSGAMQGRPDWQPLQAPAGAEQPPREFCFGKLRRNLKQGTARLEVRVPTAGSVLLRRGPGVKRSSRVHRGEGAGTVELQIRPRGRAKRRLSQAGKRRARVRVRARVIFEPAAGEPLTRARHVRLVKAKGS